MVVLVNKLDLFKTNSIDILNQTLNMDLPEFDLIVATMRPSLKERLVNNINQQTVKMNVISIVVQNYSEEDIQYLKDAITNCNELFITSEDKGAIFGGGRYNIAMTKCKSDIIANFDDDDIYHPEYMRSMLYWQLQSQDGMASKVNIIARDKRTGLMGWLLTKLRFGDNHVGAGCCMIFTRKVYDRVGGFLNVRQGYDAVFQREVMKLGYLNKSADPFNFIYTRGRPEGNTWQPGRTGIRHNNIKYHETILSI